ncbi:MAG: sigma-54 interaction domain-containing protein [Desulfovibrionales bacterium]
MAQSKYHLSITILVPIIVGGVSFLAVMTASSIMALFGADSEASTLQMALFSGTAAFFCSMGLLQLVLKPVRSFLKKARKVEILRSGDSKDTKQVRKGDLEMFDQVFDQVAQALGKLDAKALFPEVVGQSRAIRAVLNQIVKVAPTETSVLIRGESGTGKELVAASIHGHSLRKGGPFIAVNCAAIPENLLESELFGHEKGAFTGAVSTKKGKFEAADRGSLFLDEIGDMPLETQAKILRVLETGVCERVGGNRPIRFNVRVIAATNKNLEKMIEKGEFREDLYHRLNVFPVLLPPLRERKEDIPLLAAHFLERFRKEKDLQLSVESLQLLLSSPLTGNVRELRNMLERAAVLAENGVINPEHLIGRGGREKVLVQETEDQPGVTLDDKIADMEKSMIMAALSKTGGVQVQAAKMLGIKERSLWHRIRKYDIDVSRFKN